VIKSLEQGGEQDETSDDALVAAVGDKSHQALGEIYDRHGRAVWSVARRICPTAALAEEVSQAVFTELWSHPERFGRSRGGLRWSLVAEAHARAVDASRSVEGGSGTERTPAPTDDRVAGQAGAPAARAPGALGRLASIERDAILLAYFGGRGSSETARLLGTLDDDIKGHIRRGLLNLRRALEVEGVTT
jgi:RNA polymerase sigma-70 factor (ECF subfamily)